MGHILALPFAVLPDWPGDLDRLHDAGYTTVALTPAADAVDLDRRRPARSTRGRRSCWARRGRGSRPRRSRRRGCGPGSRCAPGVDSLGVAAAAAIAFATLR